MKNPASDYVIERIAAIRAVRTASRICRKVQHQLVNGETLSKEDRSPVTVADFASQALICALLGQTFADDVIVAEEQADVLRDEEHVSLCAAVAEHVTDGLSEQNVDRSQVLEWIDRGGKGQASCDGRFWTVDPIDGTKGFLRRGQYAVALALIEDGQVVLGVLGCPNLPTAAGGAGALLLAIKGDSACELSLDGDDDIGRCVTVSDLSDVQRARFCESVESDHSSHGASAQIARALAITSDPLRMDSQAKYATVARGDAHIYLRLPTNRDYRECIWDHAAGMIVVTQAGGRVTDAQGKPLAFTRGRRLEANRGIVATNGPLHDQVLQAVATVLESG